MNTTGSKQVGETGMFSVGYVQRGRQNAKRHYLMSGGHVVFVNAQSGRKADALKLAERCDRLVAMWRSAAK
jgi:hypothetical protein